MPAIPPLESLGAFIADVRELSLKHTTNPAGIPEAALEALQNTFKELKGVFGGLSNDALSDLDPEQQRILRYFEMGREQQSSFLKPFISRIAKANSGEQASIFLAEFIKSHECRRVLNGRRFQEMGEEDQVQIKRMLGGLLGVHITDDFIRSIRYESMADVLAYALSGLSDVHVMEYAKRSGSLKKKHPNVQDYLSHQLREGRVRARYEFKVSEGEVRTAFCDGSRQSLESKAQALKNSGSRRRTAPANEVDSTYVNHETKTIVLCSVTANGSVAGYQQASALAKARVALVNWIDSADCHWPNKEEYKANIQTVVVNGGLVPTHNPQESGPGKTYEGKSLLKSMGLDEWDDSFKDRVNESFAMVSFLSYMCDEAAGPLVAEIMYLSNYFCVGSDTYGLWEEMRSLQKESRGPDVDRQYAKFILSKLLMVVDTLEDSRVLRLSLDGDGRTHLMRVVEVCNGVLENHFVNFPVHGRLDKEEERLLLSIGKKLGALGPKMVFDGANNATTLVNKVLTTSAIFSSSDLIEGRAKVGILIDSGRAKSTRHDESSQEKLVAGVTEVERQKHIESLTSALQENLTLPEKMYGGPDFFLHQLADVLEECEPITNPIRKMIRSTINLVSHELTKVSWGQRVVEKDRWNFGMLDVLGNENSSLGGYEHDYSYSSTKSHNKKKFRSDFPNSIRFVEAIEPFAHGNLRGREIPGQCARLAEFVVDVVGVKKTHPVIRSIKALAETPSRRLRPPRAQGG